MTIYIANEALGHPKKKHKMKKNTNFSKNSHFHLCNVLLSSIPLAILKLKVLSYKPCLS